MSTNSTGLAAPRWSRGQIFGNRRCGRREAGQAPRAFEDGDGAVGIVVHPDGRPDQVQAQRGRRDLQVAAAPGDAVVVADPAVFLDREHVAPERLGDHDERRGRLLWGDREGTVVLGQVDLAKEAVGGLDGGDSGQRQLFGQAVLEGAKGALAPASGLGRVGRDVADAARLAPSADLGGRRGAARLSARPTWVSWVLDTLPPASGVKK